jgi:nicotinamide mononucleotide adenylyltransferase
MAEVAIIYGRFQPLSKAHYNMIQSVINKHTVNNTFVFPVQGEKAYSTTAKTEKGKKSQLEKKLARNPLPVGLRISLITKAFPKLDQKQILKLKQGSIIAAYEEIQRMYPKNIDTLYVYCGEDEYESYSRQAEQMMEKEEYSNIDVQVKKYEEGTRIKTATGEIESSVSGTKLRQSITLENKEEAFEEYKKLIAPPLADRETFQKLRSALKKIQKLDIEEGVFEFFDVINEEIYGN